MWTFHQQQNIGFTKKEIKIWPCFADQDATGLEETEGFSKTAMSQPTTCDQQRALDYFDFNWLTCKIVMVGVIPIYPKSEILNTTLETVI